MTFNCGPCGNVLCIQYGCQKTSSCPAYYGFAAPVQKGCICPPTSEQTCQNPNCGRKPPFSALMPQEKNDD